MKQKTTASILAFLLGGFGAHKFYLGKTGLGVVYLLFFWTFIPAIIAFIEFIILLTMDENTFNLKYNSGNITLNYTADELEKLHVLKEKGIITENEYNIRKSKLI